MTGMRVRYDVLRIITDRWGRTYFEVADLQTGVIFWTKKIPR